MLLITNIPVACDQHAETGLLGHADQVTVGDLAAAHAAVSLRDSVRQACATVQLSGIFHTLLALKHTLLSRYSPAIQKNYLEFGSARPIPFCRPVGHAFVPAIGGVHVRKLDQHDGLQEDLSPLAA